MHPLVLLGFGPQGARGGDCGIVDAQIRKLLDDGHEVRLICEVSMSSVYSVHVVNATLHRNLRIDAYL